MTFRVEKVKSGRYTEPTLTFGVHSPTRAGLRAGGRYTIEATWNGLGYEVRESDIVLAGSGDEDVQRVESSKCSSRERQRQTLYAVSFPPEATVATVVEWWSLQTCGRFLLPRAFGERKIALRSYGVVLYEEAEALFVAVLRSASLGLQKAGRFRRVVESAKPDEPRRAVLPRCSIEQLQLTSVVSSPVDPVALIRGPKGGAQMVRLGDRVGKGDLQVVEIEPDHVVFGASDDGGKDGPTPAAKETLRAVVSPGWEIGAGWVGTPGP